MSRVSQIVLVFFLRDHVIRLYEMPVGCDQAV